MNARTLFPCLVITHLLFLTPARGAELANDAVKGRTLSLKGDGMPLSMALRSLEKETGMKVIDRRGTGDDPRLRLDLEGVTFWQAVDGIARAANARVDLYQADRNVALVRGPWRPQVISYHGLFRLTAKRCSANVDLEAQVRTYRLTVEIAWEPRFRPYLLDTRVRGLTVQAGSAAVGELPPPSGGAVAVETPLCTSVDLRLPTVPRGVDKLTTLEGSFSLVGTDRMLEFKFPSLAVLDADAGKREQTQEKVRVSVRKPVLDEDRWTVEVHIENPARGPMFESFQSWAVFNEISLVGKDGRARFPNNGGSTEQTAGNRAAVSYHFVDEPAKGLRRGKPDQWTLSYRTPAAIVEMTVPFSFKDVVLP